ncbi:MAG: hydrolase [Pseudomonadota bacterium]
MRDGSPTATHGHIVQCGFKPHPLLRNAHLQTLVPALLRPLPKLAIRRERLELPDGDYVDLGWCGEQNAGAPLAVLVHGLTGGFESKYLRGTARKLIKRGWRCVLLQLRGGGNEANRTAWQYNHGDSRDLRYLWHELKRREPQTSLYSLGWSLGANITLKALAEEGDAAPITAAAVASVPFELKPCAEKLRTGFARVYQNKMLRELYAIIRRKHGPVPVPSMVNLSATLAAKDFFEFDDAYIAPIAGYKNALDYYTRCSSRQFLKSIRKPTLIVHALDDPFMTPDIVPMESELSSQVTLELSQRGGHVGFIAAGAYGQPAFWLEQRLTDFLFRL